MDKEHFQQHDISTRLTHLTTHLTQIQSLIILDEVASFMRQSLHFSYKVCAETSSLNEITDTAGKLSKRVREIEAVV
ncbi:MAG: hypothetical protein KI793_35420 [Rivularia sp. (in: Bacteria)]|nr:hypothetical protein [Rivularia sp. MS3]